MEQEYLTVSEAAQVTGMHKNTAYAWLHRDGLRHYRTPSGRILIRRKDLESFLMEVYEDQPDVG